MSILSRSVKSFLVVCPLLIFCLSCPVHADQVRVVVAMPSSVEGTPVKAIVDAFSKQLRADVPGVDIVLFSLEKDEMNNAEQMRAKLSKASANVIVAVGSKLAKSIQAMGLDTPVVFTMVLAPDRSKVSPPGVSLDIPYQKKFEQLSSILGGLSQVGVLYSSEMGAEVDRIKEGCALLKCQVTAIPVMNEKDLPAAIQSAMSGVQLFVMTPDTKIYFPKAVEQVLSEALKKRVAVLGLSSVYTKAGALASFDCDYPALGQQTAGIVTEFLNGKHPDQAFPPDKIQYSINVQIAKKIGVDIDDSWIKGAQEIFGR